MNLTFRIHYDTAVPGGFRLAIYPAGESYFYVYFTVPCYTRFFTIHWEPAP